ncbi:MAG: tetratricopeptide repeat protein [Acidobacteria bacterium]|nr:tetratricopeptide repeat protein [Acidobacteriota bacterium]
MRALYAPPPSSSPPPRPRPSPRRGPRAPGGGPGGGPGGEHVIYGELRVDEREAGQKTPTSFTLVLMAESGKIVDRRAAMNGTNYRFLGLRNGGYEIAVEFGGIALTRVRLYLDAPRAKEFRQDISLAWDANAAAKFDPKKGAISAADYYGRRPANRALFDKAAGAIKKKKFDEAAALLQQIVGADGQDHIAWNYLGTVHNALGRAAEAERSYERALMVKPELLAAAVNLGRLHIAGKDFAQAVEVLSVAVEQHSQSADAQQLMGEAYLQTGKLAEAATHFREALRLDPQGKAEAHLRLAALEDAGGRKAKAAAELEHFLAKNPDHPNRKQFEQYVKDNKKKQ